MNCFNIRLVLAPAGAEEHNRDMHPENKQPENKVQGEAETLSGETDGKTSCSSPAGTQFQEQFLTATLDLLSIKEPKWPLAYRMRNSSRLLSNLP